MPVFPDHNAFVPLPGSCCWRLKTLWSDLIKIKDQLIWTGNTVPVAFYDATYQWYDMMRQYQTGIPRWNTAHRYESVSYQRIGIDSIDVYKYLLVLYLLINTYWYNTEVINRSNLLLLIKTFPVENGSFRFEYQGIARKFIGFINRMSHFHFNFQPLGI